MITVSYLFHDVASFNIAFRNGSRGTPPEYIPLADGGFLALHRDGIGSSLTEAMATTAYTATGTVVPGSRIVWGPDGGVTSLVPSNGIGLQLGGAALFATTLSGSSTQLTAQLVTANGSALSGAPIVLASVASSAPGAIAGAELAPLADGGFVATWTIPFSLRDVRTAVFNADGSVRRAAFDVAATAADEQLAQIAALTTGGFVEVWLATSGGTTGLWARRYAADGQPAAAAVEVRNFGAAPPTELDVLGLQGGAYVIAYTSVESHVGETGAVDVARARFSIFEADGTTRVSDVLAPLAGSVGRSSTRALELEPVGDGLFGIGGRETHWFRGATYSLIVFDDSGTHQATHATYSDKVTARRYYEALGDGRIGYVNYDSTFGSNSTSISEVRRTLTSDDAGDVVEGDDRAETLVGNGGEDMLRGNGGDDVMHGGTGRDTLEGGTGRDRLEGGDGDDTLAGGADADVLDGGIGIDGMDGGSGDDVIAFDAADTFAQVIGGQGYDTLVVRGATSVPTHLALVAQGFEQANVEFVDGSGQSWSSITLYYDALWRLLARNVVNDDTTSVTTVFDHDASRPWSSYDQTFNSGQLAWQRTYYDDGRYETQVYDSAGRSWSSYIDFTSATGQLTTRRTFLDSGRFETEYFDIADDPVWSRYIDYSDAAGRVDARRAVLDNGRLETTYFDVLSASSWSNYTDFVTPAGTIDARRVVFDDGSWTNTYWDLRGEQTWAFYTDWFGSGGTFLLRTGQYDDGTLF